MSILSVVFLAMLSMSVISCNDDDKDEEESIDYTSMLRGHWKCTYGDSEYETLSFRGTNSILYEYLYSDDNETGGYGIYASGTFAISDNVITANYDYVDLMDATSLRGFTTGQSKTVQYTIESIKGNKMVLIYNGNYLSFEKYAEAN